MPRKKSVRKTEKRQPKEEYHFPIEEPAENEVLGISQQKKRDWKLVFFAVLVIGLIGLFLTNKGLLLAAVVNGKPIFRWELNKAMTERYGAQTLEGMVSERLIAEEAAKANVSVSQDEIDTKEKEIVRGLGGDVSIEEVLQYQGMTKEDFDNQIKLQLTVQKLLGKDIQITDNDINNFIATNRAMLSATVPAELQEEARAAILEMKIGEKIQPWFTEVKQKASILRYL